MKASRLIKQEQLAIFLGDDPEAEDAADDTLNVTVNPGVLTPAKDAAIRASDDNDTGPIVDLLLDIVVEWDLVDDEGVVVPLTKPVLMDTPIIVLALTLNGISEELRKKAEAEGKISAAT